MNSGLSVVFRTNHVVWVALNGRLLCIGLYLFAIYMLHQHIYAFKLEAALKKRKAELILDQGFAISSRYRLILKVFRVTRSLETGLPRLLVDNHAPFGFHIHPALPEDRSVRVRFGVGNYNGALELFLMEAERIVRNENG